MPDELALRRAQKKLERAERENRILKRLRELGTENQTLKFQENEYFLLTAEQLNIVVQGVCDLIEEEINHE